MLTIPSYLFVSLRLAVFRLHGGGSDVSPYGANGGLGRAAEPEVVPKKGMQLGGGSKKQSMMDKLVSEDNLAPLAPISKTSSGSSSAAAPVHTHARAVHVRGVHVCIHARGACSSVLGRRTSSAWTMSAITASTH